MDQIAAGEVVERPASVVKELVENALDAGSTHIAIDVQAGGKELIRVLDNGRGMSADEAEIALRRHATSKLRALEDLFGIGTMGFRGEALPSIAAVSRVCLTTRSRDEVAARRLEVEAGEVAGRREVGAPVGTQIEVRDLLYNVPARKKFLKGDATEASHITEAIARLAMAHPEVHFRLRHGQRTSLEAPQAASGLERARALLGARAGADLAAAEGYEAGVRVRAYLAPPARAQTTAKGVQLFVGRRWVRDRSLMHAVVMGYGELLPKGRYPVAVVFIDAPGERVDINVHPQKLEVRFSDVQAVCAAVRRTVSRGVSRASWEGEPLTDPRGPAAGGPASAGPGGAAGPGPASEMATRHAAEASARLEPGRRGPRAPLREAALPLAPAAGGGSRAGEGGAAAPALARSGPPDAAPRPARAEVGAKGRDSGLGFDPGSPTEPAAEPAAEPVAEPVAPAWRFSELSYLGHFDRTYLVCERGGELCLVDQHAAHERVVFERLKARYEGRGVPVQRLLFPTLIELEPGEAAALAEGGDTLAALGFEVEFSHDDDEDSGVVRVRAYPSDLRGDELHAALSELSGDLADVGASRAIDDRLDRVLATIACHGSVRAGDALSADEVSALLADLDATPRRTHCPHGRPVMVRIGAAEIERRFGRA